MRIPNAVAEKRAQRSVPRGRTCVNTMPQCTEKGHLMTDGMGWGGGWRGRIPAGIAVVKFPS